MFRTGTGSFEKLLDKATSNLLMEPDWHTILEICDLIRQNDVVPKYALASIKKKLQNQNPYTALYGLHVLESVVKNCGTAVHEELTSKAFCEFLHELAQKTPHENVRNKLLELIQTWVFAFRKTPKYSALKDTMNAMKAEGYKFPALRESDAMFTADTAPEWADGEVCHRCRVTFSLVQRKHHCRACGQVFCGQCTQKNTSLPKFGIEKEVRVCDACYDEVTKPSQSSKNVGKQESDLPIEYLKSPLAQQSQAPPQKSEDELREEEEFQLALALSQSEAEAKEKEKVKSTPTILNPVKTEPRPVTRSPSPPPEEVDPELSRYLNRQYWESRQTDAADAIRPTSPSAPASIQPSESKTRENGIAENEIDEFMRNLRSQVEIFVNRMKSNSSRGRSIANDSGVQTFFMNITAMHSKLYQYIQQHDDYRLHYEKLQDKLTAVKDARAALDALREEHRERLRRQAEEAERQRQLQMAHKLEIMRKKKQEYLQYQRQMALQRIQEQEREMQMRQEQQKQQYIMGSQYGTYMGSPVHGQPFPGNNAPPAGAYAGYPYGQVPVGMMGPPQTAPQMGHPGSGQGVPLPQNQPRLQHPPGFPPGLPPQSAPGIMQRPSQGQPPENMPPHLHGIPQQMHGLPPNMMPQNVGSQQMIGQQVSQSQVMPQQGIPPQGQGMPPQGQGMPQGQGIPPQVQQQFSQGGGGPGNATSGGQQNGEAATAELISFD